MFSFRSCAGASSPAVKASGRSVRTWLHNGMFEKTGEHRLCRPFFWEMCIPRFKTKCDRGLFHCLRLEVQGFMDGRGTSAPELRQCPPAYCVAKGLGQGLSCWNSFETLSRKRWNGVKQGFAFTHLQH